MRTAENFIGNDAANFPSTNRLTFSSQKCTIIHFGTIQRLFMDYSMTILPPFYHSALRKMEEFEADKGKIVQNRHNGILNRTQRKLKRGRIEVTSGLEGNYIGVRAVLERWNTGGTQVETGRIHWWYRGENVVLV